MKQNKGYNLGSKVKSFKGSIFDVPVKSKARAKKISITSPSAFRESIRKIMKGNYTKADYKALILAQNRAVASSKRKNISSKEKKQMLEIGKITIPKP